MIEYYAHSGRYNIWGILSGLAAGILAGIPLAYAYDYGIVAITSVKLRIILPMAYGAIIGAAAGLGMRWSKVRNNVVAGIVSSVACAGGLYLSWIIWIVHTLYPARWILNPTQAATHPRTLWQFVLVINKVGTWGYESGKPDHGNFLWFIWAGEAVLLMGFGVLTAVGVVKWQPFCERCVNWCSEHQKLYVAPAVGARELKQKLEPDVLHSVTTLQRGDKKKPHFRLDLRSCASCHGLNTLSVVQVFPRDTKTIVDKLVLSSEQAGAIRSVELNRT